MDNVMKLMKTDKAQCSGCYACCNICPVDAIRMKVNEEGFWYPSVDETVCIHCGRCIQVCQIDNSKPPKVDMDTEAYACMNLDNGKRLASSSGGIFIELAQYVISHDGIVFGAAFDKHLKLRHTFASTMEECRAFMGSKYLQSQIGRSYSDAKRFLDQKKMVLFTGTPCQIHGLKLFLGREYANLITADLACHGVPSPAVFDKYISDLEQQHHGKVTSFYFRSKKKGWNNFCTEVHFDTQEQRIQSHNECPFDKGFLTNLYLRPSCYVCKNKGDNRYSDLVMGDYWGIEKVHKEMSDDQKGSVLFVRTEKGRHIFDAIKGNFKCLNGDDSYGNTENIAISKPVPMNPHRDDFFVDFKNNKKSNKPLSLLIRPYIPKEGVLLKLRKAIPKPVKDIIKKVLFKNRGGIVPKRKDGISWKEYALEIGFDDGNSLRVSHDSSIFMRGFLADLYLRLSCYQCQNKEGNRFSDITLADYWGVQDREKDMDDDQGTSVALVHTMKGKKLLQEISTTIKLKKTDLTYVISRNPSLKYSARLTPNRSKFFQGFIG